MVSHGTLERSACFCFALLITQSSESSEPSAADPSRPDAVERTAAPAAGQRTIDIPFEKYSLDNGLEVILSRDDRLPRVAVNLWYHVGPVNEPAQRSGFAHLFEHLMFEGSKHVKRNFDLLMESMGASNVNGTTSWDRTNYYETVPSEHLATALWIESDRMAFMIDALSTSRLEAQRDIVKNERRQTYENAPYGKSALALLDTLFPHGHPYHGAVIGSMRDLSAATLSEVRDFYRTYYAPNNATLTLVGAFEARQAKSLVERYFGSLQRRELPKTESKPTPPLQKPVRQIVEEQVALAQVSLGWITPPAYSKADAALNVALSILSGGKATRLYRKLVVETRLASEVSGYIDANRLCSIVSIDARATDGSDVKKLEAVFSGELDALANTGPSEAELSRARRRLNLDLFRSLELLNGGDGESGRAGLLQRFNHYQDDPGYADRWAAILNSVTGDDVKAAVRQHLSPQHRVTVITEPLTQDDASNTTSQR